MRSQLAAYEVLPLRLGKRVDSEGVALVAQLRLVLGRAGSGKTHHCIETLAQLSRRVEQGEQPPYPAALLIVPEQATFIHERLLAEACGGGYAYPLVTSFPRLAYQALGQGLPPVSEAAKLLAICRILREQQPQLTLLGRSAQSLRGGFARKLLATIEELQAYQASPQRLLEVAECLAAEGDRGPLWAKLHDTAMIYQAYEARLNESFAVLPQGMERLVAAIAERPEWQGVLVLIDGYSGFTPQELAVIAALLQHGARVEIALAVDAQRLAAERMSAKIWYPAEECYWQLRRLAEQLGVCCLSDLCLQGEQGRFCAQPELALIERAFAGEPVSPWPAAPEALQIAYAANRSEEMQGVARQIHRLVREQGLHYGQISVIARDSALYEDALQAAFADYQIPYFIDRQKPLYAHPLVELLRAALACWQQGLRQETVFRYLKNIYAPLLPEEKDELENYCLANGIRPRQWLAEQPWQMDRQGLGIAHVQRMDQLRRSALAALGHFLAALPEPLTAAQLLQALQQLLVELEVVPRLQQQSELAWQDARPGTSELAEEHRQLAQRLEEFMTEAQQLLGEESYTGEVLAEMLQAALAQLQLSVIPPGVDQVLVASLERSRNPEIAAAFVVGVNADILPAKVQATGLYHDQDRRLLALYGLPLAPDLGQRQLAESYLVYVALTRSSRFLYLSYSLQDEQGAALAPSPLLGQCRALFPQLQEHCWQAVEDPADLCGGAVDMAELAKALAGLRQGQQPAAFWRQAYEYFAADVALAPLLAEVLAAYHYQGQDKPLAVETTAQLYGQVMRTSVSRLERYRACPLAYFANDGLRLKERQQAPLSPLERGDFFHQALAWIGREAARRGLVWAELDEEQARQWVDEALAVLGPSFASGLLLQSGRNHYLLQRMKGALVSSLLVMAEHSRAGCFVPIAWELPFGQGEAGIPAWVLTLPDGKKLEIQGVIDRVDVAHGPTHDWLRIIDYKTGETSLHAEDIFSGLKLQLIVYLQVVLLYAPRLGLRQPEAAGIYYAPVHDMLQDMALPAEDAPCLPDLRYEGLSVLDEEAVRLADAGVAGFSRLVPVALGKNGFYSNSPGVSPAQLRLLLQQMQKVLVESAQAMLNGWISASPWDVDSLHRCDRCQYRAFCAFDQELAPVRRWERVQAKQEWQRETEALGEDA